MNFDIRTEQLSGDAYVISLTGEVDLYTAPECATVVRCLGETDGGPQPEPEGGPDAEGGA
jgi:hypothetical protein